MIDCACCGGGAGTFERLKRADSCAVVMTALLFLVKTAAKTALMIFMHKCKSLGQFASSVYQVGCVDARVGIIILTPYLNKRKMEEEVYTNQRTCKEPFVCHFKSGSKRTNHCPNSPRRYAISSRYPRSSRRRSPENHITSLRC